MTKKTAEELVRTCPGAFERRREIILALCRGGRIKALPHYTNTDPKTYGQFIAAVANKIIEETENQTAMHDDQH